MVLSPSDARAVLDRVGHDDSGAALMVLAPLDEGQDAADLVEALLQRPEKATRAEARGARRSRREHTDSRDLTTDPVIRHGLGGSGPGTYP